MAYKDISNEELKHQLVTLPSLIATKAKEAEDANLKYTRQKTILSALESEMILKEKKKNPKLAISNLKEVISMKLKEETLTVLDMESAYKKIMIDMQELDNKFTAYKRIAQIRIAEMTSGIGYKE